MGCFFSIFKFGTYVVKESEPNTNNDSQVNVPEIRKHSSTPVVELTPKQLQEASVKPLLAKHPDKSPGAKQKKKDVDKEKTLYTTTFETQVDAAPPHPLEEKFQDIQLEEIEIDTNIFTPEVEDAVVKIQAGVRGYLARKHIQEHKKDLDDSVLTNQEEIPVVPPPKNFENQTLTPSSDLDQWKRLSQHLEDKMVDVIDGQTQKEESIIQPTINGPLTEAVIPLKDSNDNKVIETYDCKENILDVEPTEEQPVFSQLMTSDNRVVDRVFDVLMSETESESIIDFIETKKSKIESSVVEPIKEIVNDFIGDNTEDNSQELEVLANLNAILDNNDSNVENISENDVKPKEDNNQTLAEESVQSNVVEMMSQNTTQEIIRNSFHEFVKEMTENKSTTDPKPKEEKSPEVQIQELVLESEKPVFKSQSEEPKVEERKTDSMLFEEDVVQTIFDEEMSKNRTKNQIFAIEVFKDDVKDEQLVNVTTLCEPEPAAINMWGVEDKVCKTSIEQFVVKQIESQIPIETIEDVFTEQSLETVPVLETEQKIEVISSQSRKNSEDLLELGADITEAPLIETEVEVLPIQSPTIQVEEQNGRILDEEEAAIRIQAAFRGYQIRRSMSREPSPNRGTNHNNIDSNNNNHNNVSNDNEVEYNETAVQWIESNLQTNNELSADFTPNEQFLTTNQVSDDANNQLISTSVEQIDTSLERLEDQLMQELISTAEEEERTQALLIDNLDTQKLVDDIDSGELTAPLLLQRIQQSMSSNASNTDSEEQVPKVVHLNLEAVPIDAQTPAEEQIKNEVESSGEVDDRPLIKKSDTIIMDLMSSSPQRMNSLNETNSNLIRSDFSTISDQLIDSEVVIGEESNGSPFVVSEVLKDSNTEIKEIKTEEVTQNPTELITESSDPQLEPKPQALEEVKQQLIGTQESVPIEETRIPELEVVDNTESQPELIQSQKLVEISHPEPFQLIENQPIDNQRLEIIETTEEQPIETQEQEPTPENIKSSKPKTEVMLEPEHFINLAQNQTELEPTFESTIEPPTPDLEKLREVTPELSFIQSSEEAVLTKICSSESEQEAEAMSTDKLVESRPSMIPVLESNHKTKSGEQSDTVFKRPKPILKEKESKIYANIIPDEQTHSTSEEISSPDDDNPEFVGLGTNTPIPVRASSPNPFGKKRRRGKKGAPHRK